MEEHLGLLVIGYHQYAVLVLKFSRLELEITLMNLSLIQLHQLHHQNMLLFWMILGISTGLLGGCQAQHVEVSFLNLGCGFYR